MHWTHLYCSAHQHLHLAWHPLYMTQVPLPWGGAIPLLFPPMLTPWPIPYLLLSLLHLIPVVYFLSAIVILTLASECFSKITLSSYICGCGAARRNPSLGPIQGKAEHHLLPPDFEMLSNAGNQIWRGIAFTAISALILLAYEWMYDSGGQMSAISFHKIFTLPYSFWSFILPYFHFLFLVLFRYCFLSFPLVFFLPPTLSLSSFSSAALPALHYCHLFSQPLNPWCCSNWQTGFKSTFERACLFK